MKAGLYLITNTVTGKSYAGKSYNVLARLGSHKSGLRHGKHNITALQADYDKYGEAAFTFERANPVCKYEADPQAFEWRLINQSKLSYNTFKRDDVKPICRDSLIAGEAIHPKTLKPLTRGKTKYSLWSAFYIGEQE